MTYTDIVNFSILVTVVLYNAFSRQFLAIENKSKRYFEDNAIIVCVPMTAGLGHS